MAYPPPPTNAIMNPALLPPNRFQCECCGHRSVICVHTEKVKGRATTTKQLRGKNKREG